MRSRHLRWRLIRRMPGMGQGEFLSLARGTGFDLVHLTPYQTGDDVRRIDWHASARSGELQVRQLQEDRDITCWLVADLSASQQAGLSEHTKRAQLLETATLIVDSIGQHGNRIGLWIDDGQEHASVRLPARAGRSHLLRLLGQLQAHRPPGPGHASNLTRLFAQLSLTLKRRSLVVILSDFLSNDPSPEHWQPRLAALARRHDLIAIHLEDPSEWALPDEGHFMVEDAETGEQLWVDADDDGFRSRYEAALESERRAVHEALHRAGARLLVLHPGQDALQALARWMRRPLRRRLA